MPLIEINMVETAGVDRAAVGKVLTAAIAEVLDCRPDAVWAVWRTIDGPFVRGSEASTDPGAAAPGPIVHVYHHRTTEQVGRIVETIETVLARELSLEPGQVFVTTQPVAIHDPTLP